MSRFKEVIIEDHEFAVKYGRPKTDLPVAKIFELSSKGCSCRDIAEELGKLGIKTSKDTVNRLIRNAGGKN